MPRDGKVKGLVGVVSSDTNDKTITVVVERLIHHAQYKKYIRRNKKLQVHDSANVARKGDVVRIIPSRPMSRTKRWRMVEVISSGS